jgi:UDP-GlcNAc:undecaprenyl-phosphate/decaprenyl-phosphate GlcNAc-1-phosphate transferase
MSAIHFHGWFNGVTSFLVCVSTLPIVCHLAARWQLHDRPGPLKIHTSPIPRLGGIALGLALIAGISVGGTGLFSQALYFYLALLLIWITGLADDLWSLSPWVRLPAQLGAGLLISQTHWAIQLFGHPILNAAATCLFVAIFVNAFNFLDGADGLAASVTGMVGLGYILLYTNRAASVGAAVAWSLLGACVGFLLFNFPPARVFMGDSGSTVLGLLVAFLSLDFYRVHQVLGTRLLLPLVFAGLPLMDFLLAVFRRVRNGVSPFSGDRQHFYDLLLQRGWSARPVAVIACVATALLILGGWLCDQPDRTIGLVILMAMFGYMFITAIRLGSLR